MNAGMGRSFKWCYFEITSFSSEAFLSKILIFGRLLEVYGGDSMAILGKVWIG